MVKTWGWISFILFCLGVILAVIGGISMGRVVIALILVIFGFIIGLIHVSIDKRGMD